MDKLRISLNSSTYEVLSSDMEAFSIYKENGEINRNDFFNRLIINYTDEFISENNKLVNFTSKLLDKYIKEDDDKNKVSHDIIKHIVERYNPIENDSTIIISLKPTKASESIIDYVINEGAAYQSNASFFRIMFDKYASLEKTKREQLIFKDSYLLLLKSINKGRKVFVKLRNKNKDSFSGSLYFMGVTKDKDANYCIFETNKQRVTVRLSKIEMVKILNEPASFEKRNIALMDFQKEYCLRYQVSRKDLDAVKVFLNDDGKKMYRKNKNNRPSYIEEEDGYYYFMGNHEQILSYFLTFGKNALILEPLYLRKKMEDYLKEILQAYSKIKN